MHCLHDRLVSSTDIVEMEWKGRKFNLTVRKSEALKAAEPVYQVSRDVAVDLYSGLDTCMPCTELEGCLAVLLLAALIVRW